MSSIYFLGLDTLGAEKIYLFDASEKQFHEYPLLENMTIYNYMSALTISTDTIFVTGGVNY